MNSQTNCIPIAIVDGKDTRVKLHPDNHRDATSQPSKYISIKAQNRNLGTFH